MESKIAVYTLPRIVSHFILMTTNLYMQIDPPPDVHNILPKGIRNISIKMLNRQLILNMSKT